MYVTTTTTYDFKQIKESPANASLSIPQKCLKENKFFDEEFLKQLHIGKLKRLASDHGVCATGKKPAIIRRLLNLQHDSLETKSKYRLRKNEKYYGFFARWNNCPKNWFKRILTTCPLEYVLRTKNKNGMLHMQGFIGFKYQRYPSALRKLLKGVRLEKQGSDKRCYRFCRDLSPRDDNTHIQGFERYFEACNGKISEVQRVRWKKEVLDIACVTEIEYEHAHTYECPECFGLVCEECIERYQLQLTVLQAFYQWKGWKWKKDEEEDELSTDSES